MQEEKERNITKLSEKWRKIMEYYVLCGWVGG